DPGIPRALSALRPGPHALPAAGLGAEGLLRRDPSRPDRGTPGHMHDPSFVELPWPGCTRPGHERREFELVVLGFGEGLARGAPPVHWRAQHLAALRGLRRADDDRSPVRR